MRCVCCADVSAALADGCFVTSSWVIAGSFLQYHDDASPAQPTVDCLLLHAQHAKYHHQFRAMFAMNVNVSSS